MIFFPFCTAMVSIFSNDHSLVLQFQCLCCVLDRRLAKAKMQPAEHGHLKRATWCHNHQGLCWASYLWHIMFLWVPLTVTQAIIPPLSFLNYLLFKILDMSPFLHIDLFLTTPTPWHMSSSPYCVCPLVIFICLHPNPLVDPLPPHSPPSLIHWKVFLMLLWIWF